MEFQQVIRAGKRAHDVMATVPIDLDRIISERAEAEGVPMCDLAGEMVRQAFASGVAEAAPSSRYGAAVTTIRVRLSAELREKVNAAARAAGRSPSMECRLRLERMVAAAGNAPAVDPKALAHDIQALCERHGIRPSAFPKWARNLCAAAGG
jgi:hypothetical protein